HRVAAERMQSLYSVSQALGSTLSLNERLRIVASAISAATRSSRCSVMLVQDGRLEFRTAVGLSRSEMRQAMGMQVPINGRTRLTTEGRKGKAFIVEVQEMEPPDRQRAEEWNLIRALIVPLVFKG